MVEVSHEITDITEYNRMLRTLHRLLHDFNVFLSRDLDDINWVVPYQQ